MSLRDMRQEKCSDAFLEAADCVSTQYLSERNTIWINVTSWREKLRQLHCKNCRYILMS